MNCLTVNGRTKVQGHYNYSGDSSLESDELDEVIEVHTTQIFVFQPEHVTVKRVINLMVVYQQ